MKNSSKLLALLGLGALAFWRYKKATPEEKQKVNDLLNNAKDNLTKYGNELKSKAEELKGKAEEKFNDLKSQSEPKMEEANEVVEKKVKIAPQE